MTDHTIAGVAITDDLVRDLLRRHAPEYADDDIGRYYWHAPHRVTVRIGDSYGLRLSREVSDEVYDDQALTALRALAPQWPVPAQIPLVHVPPTDELPVPWDVVPWFEGVSAVRSPLNAAGAVTLGMALRAIHTPAPMSAPRHPLTSAPLSEHTEAFEIALATVQASALDGELSLDLKRCQEVWTEAVAAPVDVPPTWIHGALDPQFVIVDDAQPVAIIEWQFFGAGDPALDLGAAALLCGPDDVDGMLNVYDPNLSAATYARARGVCLWRAARLVASHAAEVAALGWDRLRQLHVASS